MNDRDLLFVTLGLVALNLYLTYRIAEGLDAASSKVDGILNPITDGLARIGVKL